MNYKSSIVPDTLVREAFREQAIRNGKADDCVIDSQTYASISGVDGCFLRNNRWVVYCVDDHKRIVMEKEFSSSIKAYTELARRLGFAFHVPVVRTKIVRVPKVHRIKTSIITPTRRTIVCKAEETPPKKSKYSGRKNGTSSKNAKKPVYR